MEGSSFSPRRSSRVPKPVNFNDYDDYVFDDSPLFEEIDEEEEGKSIILFQK